MRSIQPYGLINGDVFGGYYIDVPEGSDLLDVTIDTMGVYSAWCIVEIGLPLTKRFFRIMMPGSNMPDRGDALRYVSTVNDGGMVWLVFEDNEARQEYLTKKYAEAHKGIK